MLEEPLLDSQNLAAGIDSNFNKQTKQFSHMVKIQVLRYFSYTSIVVNRLATYIEDKDEGSFEVMEFFEAACKKAFESNEKREWHDNKCAFEVLIEGRILYVGYYDGKYSLGLGISGIGGNRVYDFLTRTWLPYGENNS